MMQMMFIWLTKKIIEYKNIRLKENLYVSGGNKVQKKDNLICHGELHKVEKVISMWRIGVMTECKFLIQKGRSLS